MLRVYIDPRGHMGVEDYDGGRVNGTGDTTPGKTEGTSTYFGIWFVTFVYRLFQESEVFE